MSVSIDSVDTMQLSAPSNSVTSDHRRSAGLTNPVRRIGWRCRSRSLVKMALGTMGAPLLITGTFPVRVNSSRNSN